MSIRSKKNQKDLSNLILQYEENATIHGKATLDGGYVIGNKAFDKMEELFILIEELDAPQFNNFSELLKDENVTVVTASASKLLRTAKHNEAVEALYNIIEKDSSILSFNAEMVLKELA